MDAPEGKVGERRWPAALTVLVALILPLTLAELGGWLRYALSCIGVVLLIAVMVVDPGRIDRRTRVTRALSIGMVLLLAVIAASGTVRLIVELLDGAPSLNNPATLLVTGGVIWLENSLVFALLFWELDGGGPAGRLHGARPHPDFAFPQQMSPELAPAGWRPEFGDYLYLGLTNALAFSPTDAMPLTHPAKLAMAVQSLISVSILSLVVANAVNILS